MPKAKYNYSAIKINSRSELKAYIEKYAIKSDGRTNFRAIEPHLQFIYSILPNAKGKITSEIVYWIMHDLHNRPTCPECGNPINKFKGLYRGYTNFCSKKCKTLNSDVMVEKIQRTKQIRYGDSHYNNMEKNKKTCIDRYGVSHFSKTPQFKKFIVEKCLEDTGLTCYCHKAKQEFASKSGTKFLKEIQNRIGGCLEFPLYDTKFKRAYRYDYASLEHKLIIEYNGTYWHMDPTQYGPMDWNEVKQMFAFEIWEYDKRKKELAESLGFTVRVVWEN